MEITGNISNNTINGSVCYNTLNSSSILLGTTTEYLNKNYLNITGGTITGNLTLKGNLILNNTVYDDMQFPSILTKKGANDKPDVDYTNIGLLFPQNDETEYIVIGEQFSHKYKIGSNIYPHIHYTQTSASVPTFVLQYKWYSLGKPVPSNYTTIQTNAAAFVYTGGTMQQLLSFPAINGSNITGVSSWFEAKLYRKTGDGVTGDVLSKSFDIHYEIDSIGSDEIYIK